MNSNLTNSCDGQSWGCIADNREISFYSENVVNCEKSDVNTYCNYQPQLPPSAQVVPRAFYNGFPNVANSLAAGQLYANPAYAPCQTVNPWNYSLCYGLYDQQQPPNPCQFTQFIDIEDFM